jgi:hypothetical protein
VVDSGFIQSKKKKREAVAVRSGKPANLRNKKGGSSSKSPPKSNLKGKKKQWITMTSGDKNLPDADLEGFSSRKQKRDGSQAVKAGPPKKRKGK